MRKKSIFIIGIILVLLTGCSQKTNDVESKIENVSNQKDNEFTEINNIIDVELKSVRYTCLLYTSPSPRDTR